MIVKNRRSKSAKFKLPFYCNGCRYLDIIRTWPFLCKGYLLNLFIKVYKNCHLRPFSLTRKKWRLRRHFCSLRLPTNAMPLDMPSQILIPEYHFYLINNSFSTKYAPKSVPGLADVGILHGNGPRTPPRCLERSGKGFKWLILLCLTIVVL